MKSKTTKAKILSMLKRGHKLTQVTAIKLGCYRLSARIHELREELGHDAISTTINRHGMAVYKWEGAK